ncbi:galactolipase DONGLE, chloroplastic-like [Tasmannia lanceolata]|uniref:galactolipase DONGLE, chloroplastic-like n=1 Tax=Tasmannia lanceolata TaxID=3420 RepID=UPI0040629E7D
MASSLFTQNPSPITPKICFPKPRQSPFVQQIAFPMKNSIPQRQSIKASYVGQMGLTKGPNMRPSKSETSSNLAGVWREIQGSENWEDLVEPLNPLLRDEIIRYGEFVTTCYKAFDLDPNSKRYLNCKYGKKNILREVGMGECGYQVTKYIYATPDINIPIQNGTCCSRWIGYVAVSSDEQVKKLGRRDIIVTFRGTVTNPEWIANFMSSLTPARLDPHNQRSDVKVELGFLNLYTSDDSTCKFGHGSCREQLLSEISRIINEYKDEEISITVAGHSMGSSLALLLAYDIAELGLNKNESNQEIPITVYSFAGPRVGNSSFKERCEELGVKVLRVVNVNDPVTKLPGFVFNENFRVLGGRYELPWSCSCYAHVGVELALDFFKMENPSCVHDLETYISLLRCPKMLQVQSNGADLLNKAREFLSGQKFETWPWEDAARNVGNLVQSIRI